MAYKGSDLDLRTPYGHGATEEAGPQMGWPLFPELGRDGPIPVDATVLACCNAAYDAAVFHGTRDVRVEHLLYALTRVDAARDVLEQHGVRTAQLRRDAAGAIADEVPVGGTGGRTPKASAEFENVLRRAAVNPLVVYERRSHAAAAIGMAADAVVPLVKPLAFGHGPGVTILCQPPRGGSARRAPALA